MFEAKKTLIVVYKDELLMNQLKKCVETRDDTEQGIVGTRDDSISIVSWTEKVWLTNKEAGNIQGKILFLGDIKGTDKLIPVIDVMFDDCGVKFGWAGNQAVVYADPKALTKRTEYDAFLEKLSELPIPDFLKSPGEENQSQEGDEQAAGQEETGIVPRASDDGKHLVTEILRRAKDAAVSGAEAIGKIGGLLAEKSEEMFRDKSLMKRQMLFYGVMHLYSDGLEKFMNS